MYGSGNNSFTLTKDEIEKANRAAAKFLARLKEPNAISDIIDKALNEKLEKGETLVFGDEKGIYHLKKVDGIVQKTYIKYYK